MALRKDTMKKQFAEALPALLEPGEQVGLDFPRYWRDEVRQVLSALGVQTVPRPHRDVGGLCYAEPGSGV